MKKTSVFRIANSFFLFLGFFSGRVRAVCKNSIVIFVKTEFYLWQEHFTDKFSTISCFFSEILRKTFELLANYLGQNCQECPVSVLMSYSEEKFWSVFLHLGCLAKKFWPYRKKNSAGLSKLHSTFHRNNLRKTLTWFSFLELDQILLQIPAKNLWQVCRKCLVRGQRSYLKKTSVFRIANSLFISLSGFYWKVFRLSAKNTSACLSKLNSNPSQESFADKNFIVFLLFFRFSSDNSGTSI